ncbi:MAG: hypothetical protein ACR2IK_23775 [Chloroflexota bacterium]
MTPVEPDEQGKTARIEQPAPAPFPLPPSTPPAARSVSDAVDAEPAPVEFVREPTLVADRSLEPAVRQQDVVFVPLAVNVGDGFKFGCGFFLALVLAMLIGFVLLAALFVLTSLFGLNLPISR